MKNTQKTQEFSLRHQTAHLFLKKDKTLHDNNYTTITITLKPLHCIEYRSQTNGNASVDPPHIPPPRFSRISRYWNSFEEGFESSLLFFIERGNGSIPHCVIPLHLHNDSLNAMREFRVRFVHLAGERLCEDGDDVWDVAVVLTEDDGVVGFDEIAQITVHVWRFNVILHDR